MLPANIASDNDNNVLSIAASNNKGLLIRFLNEQVEDGFYALVIDYLKDSNFDLSSMMVDDEVKAHCSNSYMVILIRLILMHLSVQPAFTDTVSG